MIGQGKFCTDKSCSRCPHRVLPEDQVPGQQPVDGPAPGTCMDADAVYLANRCVLKIPDNCRCTFECTGKEKISCFCFPLGLVSQPRMICDNDKLPPGWPPNVGG